MAVYEAPKTPPKSASVTNISTPVRFSQSSLERGGGSSTHASIDDYLRRELAGALSYDVDDLDTKSLIPKSTLDRTLLDRLVRNVTMRTSCEMTQWKLPANMKDEHFVPWLAGRMKSVCGHALVELENEDVLSFLMDTMSISSGDNGIDRAGDILQKWRERLGKRCWEPSRGVRMKDGGSSRAVDLALWMGSTTARWDQALVIGEHKLAASDWKRASVQLAGYMAELYGRQPFRQFSHGFLVYPVNHGSVPKMMVREWTFDRNGGLGSKQTDMTVDHQDCRERFVQFVLRYTIMDFEQLGYDPQVCGNSACSIPFDPSLTNPGEWSPAFVNVQGITFRLNRVLFIRVGLVCRGTVCLEAEELADDEESGKGTPAIVKLSWRLADMVPEGDLLEKVSHIPGVVRLRVHNVGPDIATGIRKGCSSGCILNIPRKKQDEGQTSLYSEEEVNSEKVVASRSSNRVLTRTVMKDLGRPLREARSALQMVKAVYDAFQGEFVLFDHPSMLYNRHEANLSRYRVRTLEALPFTRDPPS
jgi:hypothetical protein